MDITLDDMLTILCKHCNNVKVLDALNQELFQLRMADKETVLDCGVHLLRHLQVLAASFPDCSPQSSSRVKERPLLWWDSQVTKCDGGHLGSGEKDSKELPRGPRTQTTNNTPKPWATSFFPLLKLKGNLPTLKLPAVHLEEENAGSNEDQESDDPSRIKGVTKEFMLHLARAVKDAQAEEKHCYHCSSCNISFIIVHS